MLVERSLVEGGTGKFEEVTLNKNTHSALLHPVEVKEVVDEEKRTLGACAVRKMPKRKLLPEKLQKVCEKVQFDLTRMSNMTFERLSF